MRLPKAGRAVHEERVVGLTRQLGFRSGLVVELERPSTDVRRAILQKRARLEGVDVEPEVLEENAQHVPRA